VWVELPAGVEALTLHEQALRRGIVVAPGPLFSARQRFSNFIRLSAGMPWSDRIASAMRTLGKLVRQ
jgi:DNA-binding transcriptional MocR family regulator